jgi:uncharacterized membrane protein YagU involved in acid resistance
MRNELRAIAYGGLLAGTLDFLAAALVNWANPLVILQVIASGVLGRDSYSDGAASMVLGLLLQWFMSLIIAAIYVFAARWLPLLRTRWVAAGTAYGIVVYFVMNFVVVPLSASNVVMRLTPKHVAINLPLMIMFGLIIAFFAARPRGRSA